MSYSNLRKFFESGDIHVMAARVAMHPGETSYYRISKEHIVIVDCLTQHGDIPVRANLTNTPGVWTIPALNTEVLLASDNGDFEGELFIVGICPQTNTPAMQAPGSLAPGRIDVVVSGDVNILVNGASAKVSINCSNRIELFSDSIEITDSPGDSHALVMLQELQATVTYLKKQFHATLGHVHATPGGPTTLITEGSVSTGYAGALTDPIGTEFLKGG